MNEVSPVLIQGGRAPVSKSPLTTIQAGVPVGVGVGVDVGVGVGEAVGVGDGVAPARLNAPIRKRHPMELVVGTYSSMYQKVVSSLGSTTMAV